MQTFLPYSDFQKCAECLDDKRLYKQIVECKQILNVLNDYDNAKGWKHHPAVLMWQGFEKALRCYQLVMLNEWLTRRWDVELDDEDYKVYKKHLPDWLGDERLHKSHRAMLYYKDNEHYNLFVYDYSTSVTMDNPKPEYYWPVKKGD